jgi:hypothetical protein
MSALRFQCWTKATYADSNGLQHGLHWVTARRARLKVFDDRLQCGDWTVAYGDIARAILFSVRSNFVVPGYVLKIETRDRTYHFGLSSAKHWKGPLPFPVERMRGRLGYSWFSLIVRIAFVVAVAYFVWARFIAR